MSTYLGNQRVNSAVININDPHQIISSIKYYSTPNQNTLVPQTAHTQLRVPLYSTLFIYTIEDSAANLTGTGCMYKLHDDGTAGDMGDHEIQYYINYVDYTHRCNESIFELSLNIRWTLDQLTNETQSIEDCNRYLNGLREYQEILSIALNTADYKGEFVYRTVKVITVRNRQWTIDPIDVYTSLITGVNPILTKYEEVTVDNHMELISDVQSFLDNSDMFDQISDFRESVDNISSQLGSLITDIVNNPIVTRYISIVQTADGSLTEIMDVSERIRQVSERGSNPITEVADVNVIISEIKGLSGEIRRLLNETEFEGRYILKVISSMEYKGKIWIMDPTNIFSLLTSYTNELDAIPEATEDNLDQVKSILNGLASTTDSIYSSLAIFRSNIGTQLNSIELLLSTEIDESTYYKTYYCQVLETHCELNFN